MNYSRALALAIVIGVCLGCNDGLAPSAATLDGTWIRQGDFPGNSEVWSLSVEGSSIAGTGTWSGEACCSGTLTVSGFIVRDSIHVDVTLATTVGANVPRDVEHFDGVLLTRTLLRGSAFVGTGPKATVQFKKQ